MKNLAHSAATVVSSTSTVLTATPGESAAEMADFASDFGDWFHPEASDFTRNWIYSESVNSIHFYRDISPPPGSSSTSALPTNTGTEMQNSRLAVEPTYKTQNNLQSLEETSKLTLPSVDNEFNRNFSWTWNSKSQECSSGEKSQLFDRTQSTITLPALQIDRTSQVRHKASLSFSQLFSRRLKDKIPLTGTRTGELDDGAIPAHTQLAVNSRIRLKIVFVGDGATGKTCFLTQVYSIIRYFPEMLTLISRASKGVMPEVCVHYNLSFQPDQLLRYSSRPCLKLTLPTLTLKRHMFKLCSGIPAVRKTMTAFGHFLIQMRIYSAFALPLIILLVLITSRKR
jgi:hypothetical protein